MRNDQLRHDLVARVAGVFAVYPTFQDLPEVAAGGFSEAMKGFTQADYIAALYAVCEKGLVLGRNGIEIVGEKVE